MALGTAEAVPARRGPGPVVTRVPHRCVCAELRGQEEGEPGSNKAGRGRVTRWLGRLGPASEIYVIFTFIIIYFVVLGLNPGFSQ